LIGPRQCATASREHFRRHDQQQCQRHLFGEVAAVACGDAALHAVQDDPDGQHDRKQAVDGDIDGRIDGHRGEHGIPFGGGGPDGSLASMTFRAN